MLKSISLQNYKSFGRRVTVPLEPITVLVGPNNSGKSSFMSLGRFVANAVAVGGEQAVSLEGGAEYLFRRPPFNDREEVEIAWETDVGSYRISIVLDRLRQVLQRDEEVWHTKNVHERWFADLQDGHVPSIFDSVTCESSYPHPFHGLSKLVRQGQSHEPKLVEIVKPVANARLVKLSPDDLRQDSRVVPNPTLSDTGLGMPSVLALWRGAQPEKSNELDAFIRQCVPEIKSILVKPAPEDGKQRLWIKQQDGQEFDALHVSDGVLCFIALAMLAIDTRPGSLLFVEEPELSVHPQRIHDLVELLREMVYQRQCQFVLATHSRVLIDQFKDQPEAIIRFRRSEDGTTAERVSDIPDLVEALRRSPPGDLVETGLFCAIDGPKTDP